MRRGLMMTRSVVFLLLAIVFVLAACSFPLGKRAVLQSLSNPAGTNLAGNGNQKAVVPEQGKADQGKNDEQPKTKPVTTDHVKIDKGKTDQAKSGQTKTDQGKHDSGKYKPSPNHSINFNQSAMESCGYDPNYCSGL